MQKNAPSWTVSGKGRMRVQTQSPGPGEYSILRQDPIHFYLSTSSRKNLNHGHQIPGPGSYSPSFTESSPKISYSINSFTKSLRASKTFKESTPGPGEYPLGSTFVNGPCYSILGRDSKKKVLPGPGPGSYSPSLEYSLEKVPSVRIGKSKREIIQGRFNGPGPASYSMDFSSLSGPKWKIGSSVRSMFRGNDTPGPGLYKIPTAGQGISYSISPGKSKALNVRNIESPGPGSYSPILSESSPRAIIGTSKREVKVMSNTPGPGAYSLDLKKSGQYAIFGSSKRKDEEPRRNSPGPGEYFIPNTFGGPRYSIRKRLPKLKTLITPVKFTQGPGSYRQDTEVIFEQEPRWSIPITGRDSEPPRAPIT